ncbi:MAG: hypothetical protein M3Y39_12515 [Chloroflexota bacterium]|nr:hypothetical protein [Chloroflexota bacterium]
MGTLIIGGLLVIALLAIVGSIFAARGGSTTGGARRTPAAAPAPKAASSETRVEAPSVATSSQLEEPAEQSLPPVPGAVNNGLTHDEPLAPTTPLPEGQPAYNSDGQVHELTTQLQALHEEARQLSQHLSILTEMAEHIEGRQSNHTEDGA